MFGLWRKAQEMSFSLSYLPFHFFYDWCTCASRSHCTLRSLPFMLQQNIWHTCSQIGLPHTVLADPRTCHNFKQPSSLSATPQNVVINLPIISQAYIYGGYGNVTHLWPLQMLPDPLTNVWALIPVVHRYAEFQSQKHLSTTTLSYYATNVYPLWFKFLDQSNVRKQREGFCFQVASRGYEVITRSLGIHYFIEELVERTEWKVSEFIDDKMGKLGVMRSQGSVKGHRKINEVGKRVGWNIKKENIHPGRCYLKSLVPACQKLVCTMEFVEYESWCQGFWFGRVALVHLSFQ